MSAPAEKIRFSRRTVVKGGAMIVGFALTGRQTSASAQGVAGAPRRLDAKEVDAFLAVNGDGSVTVYCGKVDLGQGLRVAIPQIAAEELGIGIERIKYIEGDTSDGKSQPRPAVAAKCLGTAAYVHDFTLPGMQHARVIRAPAIGATLVAVDEDSVKSLPGVKVVRINNFLAVVADDEWTAVRAARDLRAQWSESSPLPAQDKLVETLQADPGITDQTLVAKGTAVSPQPQNVKTLAASYFWPMQSHASLGPSCAVADVRADEATVWTASQDTHDDRATFARFLGLPEDKVRLIYLEGSGCYGMNGHEDAAAEAPILSRAVGRPVRVQWSRADEHGWDPKGPPQLPDIAGAVDADGRILDWRTEVWIPQP